jgi:Fe-S-cluster containining protein
MASLCDMCRTKGACCQSFHVHNDDGTLLTFDPAHGPLAPWVHMLSHGLPFIPIEGSAVEKDGRVSYTFTCSALGKDGRCRVYAIRPVICRQHEAGKGAVCENGLAGIEPLGAWGRVPHP